MLLSQVAEVAVQKVQDQAVAEQVVIVHQFQVNHQVAEHQQNL
jgi:hypothetical protein